MVVLFGEKKSKHMKCKLCGEERDFLLYVYDNNTGSDFLVCATHWNKLYFEELTEQLERNERLEQI